MTNKQASDRLSLLNLQDAVNYQICVQGHLHLSWWEYSLGLSISNTWDERGQPIAFLEGQLPDYAALMGILNYVYTLDLPLLLVEHIPVIEVN